MVSFICPGSINFSPIFRLQTFLFNAGRKSGSLQSNAKCHTHLLITEKYEPQLTKYQLIFYILVLWKLLQYCLKLSRHALLKKKLPVIPFDHGLAHLMNCSCSESFYICSLALCKAITDSKNGGGWEGLLEIILSKMRQVQLA